MNRTVLLIWSGMLAMPAFSQSIITFETVKQSFTHSIVLIGVEHSGSLFERGPGTTVRTATLMSDSCAKQFCAIYPSLIAAAQGRPIAFMMEGKKPYDSSYLNDLRLMLYRFPQCMHGIVMHGCDTRQDSVKIQTAIVLSILDTLFTDGITGSEPTFESAFDEQSVVDLNHLAGKDRDYFVYWSAVCGIENRKFEDYIVQKSYTLERQGYYVIVLCGAAHVAKIIAEHSRKDLDYALCLNDPHEKKDMLRMAKMLMVLEMMADRWDKESKK